MKRKEVVLFMIVGTGFNIDDNKSGYKLLAQKLYSTINKLCPHYVVFFASQKSEETIHYINDLFKQNSDDFIENDDYEIVSLESIDNFNDCFETFENKIWEIEEARENTRIIMDYTSGTKTMSAAMACCGMFYSKDLISVSGDRSTGEVSAGTELINYQNLYKIYDRFALMRIRNNFNANRFIPCIDILNYIVGLNIHKDSILHLCKSYYYWTTMQLEKAYSHMKQVDLNVEDLAEIKDDLENNMVALGIIVNSRSQNLKNCYILASLINNAIRKSDNYRQDDAIARLYRSFELIAQIRLSKYNLKSSDIDVAVLEKNNVSREFIDDLEKIREEGKIRIGLEKDFVLLNELNDDLGKYYFENENKIKDLTRKRNNSILAHGLESQSKEDFDKFLEVVVDLARKLDKDMDKFLNQTKFAKFDLIPNFG